MNTCSNCKGLGEIRLYAMGFGATQRTVSLDADCFKKLTRIGFDLRLIPEERRAPAFVPVWMRRSNAKDFSGRAA